MLRRIIKCLLDFERNLFYIFANNEIFVLIPKFSFFRKFANKDGYSRQGQYISFVSWKK